MHMCFGSHWGVTTGREAMNQLVVRRHPPSEVMTILPIEPFKQSVEARWYAESCVPRFIACALACIGGRALEQDREVWENKVYHKKPVLVAGDGAFLEFMRWYDQFYSEKSASLCYDW
eukprot:Skav211123  [mRNA]  locus=scaffold3631:71737:78228:- [translate_table: standard]